MPRSLFVFVCFAIAVFAHGQKLILPPLPADPMKLAVLAANTSDLPDSLSLARKREVSVVISNLRLSKYDESKRSWAALVGRMVSDNIRGLDIDATIQYILRKCVLETQEDLKSLLSKMDAINRQKKAMREYIDELKKAQQSMKESLRFAFADGRAGLVDGHLKRLPERLATKSMIEEEIKKWEEKLNGIGDDAQLANVDLQNILQRQQQTLQMMSNISKMLYDTALSVIRKMGG